VAKVTSTAIAIAGLIALAPTSAPPPRSPISSCVVATATTRAAPGALGVAAQRLEHHEGADPVVDRARHEAAVREVVRARVDHPRVADRDALQRLRLRRGADVHPELGERGGLLALGRLHEVDRLLADHAVDVAALAEEAQPLPHEHLRVPPADRADVDEPLGVDVRDDDADLVDVTGEHHRGPARGALDRGQRIARDVAADAREAGRLLAPHACRRRLEPGRARACRAAA
jgi:hypothetical protein